MGSGVLVQTGVTYAQFNGPSYNAFAGGSVLCGTGTSINIGAPSHFMSSTLAFQGIGAFSYNGAGVSVWVGSPITTYAAVYAFHGLGGVTAQSAGFLTWVGWPAFAASVLLHFAGLGGVLWKGAGAAVVALSPVYASASRVHVDGNAANFYVSGNSFSKGKGVTYVDKTKNVTTDRNGSHYNHSMRARNKARRQLIREQVGTRIDAKSAASAPIRKRRKRSAAAVVAAAEGKRYLKSGTVGLPFPWDWEQQLLESKEEGRVSRPDLHV